MDIRPAWGLIEWGLRRTGFAGVTLPWAIYLLPEQMDNQRLRRHELQHAKQIADCGVLGFYITYLWYTLRHGYASNPFEIEARQAEL